MARYIKLSQQKIKPSTSECTGRHALRSGEKQFKFKRDYFFCGEPITFRKKRKSYVLPVNTVKVKDTILGICHDRRDSWADTVQSRILSVHDLHTADAVYHKDCNVNFRTKMQIPAACEHDING